MIPQKNRVISRRQWFSVNAAMVMTAALLAPIQQQAQVSHPTSPRSPNPEHKIAEGRRVFENRCAACHGLDGRGGERAPDIAMRAAAQQRSNRTLSQIIKAGIPAAGMPAFASIDETTMGALITYVRFLQGQTGVANIPGNPRSGEALFFGEARC